MIDHVDEVYRSAREEVILKVDWLMYIIELDLANQFISLIDLNIARILT